MNRKKKECTFVTKPDDVFKGVQALRHDHETDLSQLLQCWLERNVKQTNRMYKRRNALPHPITQHTHPTHPLTHLIFELLAQREQLRQEGQPLAPGLLAGYPKRKQRSKGVM